MALAYLSLAGYICTLCQIKDHDAYVETDTQTLTLQVKTASKTHKTTNSYAFHTPKKNVGVSDVFAFVSIDLGEVIFRRGDELTSVTTYISKKEFLNEKNSMKKTFGSFK